MVWNWDRHSMGMKQQLYLCSLQLLCLSEQFRRCSQIYGMCVWGWVCGCVGVWVEEKKELSHKLNTYGTDHNTRP